MLPFSRSILQGQEPRTIEPEEFAIDNATSDAPPRRDRLHLTVQGLRVALFGPGLGGAALAFLVHALPRIQHDGTSLLLLASALLTGVASFCLTMDALQRRSPARR